MTSVKTFIQKTHIGLWVFFGLKLFILYQIANRDSGMFVSLLMIYGLSVLISMTPVGEFFLCLFAGAWTPLRVDMKERLEYLLDDVLNSVKEKTPEYAGNIALKQIQIDEPYVCALGRRTIAVSPGFFDLPEDEQTGLLASETAHLVLRHNVLMMIAGCANPLFLFMWLMLQLIKWMFRIVGVIYSLFTSSKLHRASALLTMTAADLSVKAWTALCLLFIFFESRQNVFAADRYAADIGYGYELASAIDDLRLFHPSKGFIGALFQSKPSPDARIDSLISYGVDYAAR